MALKIYFASGSPFAWRVMLAMVHKGLEFEAQEIHFSKGDNKTPEYLAMNPHGQVPVLQNDGFTLYESGAILAYLELKFPEKPLFGTDPESSAIIHQRMREVEHHFVPIMRAGVRPLFTGEYAENKETVMAELGKLPGKFEELQQWLGDKAYFSGDAPGALDFTLYPPLALIQRVLSGPAAADVDTSGILPYATVAPKLTKWMTRIEEMPGFDGVYPTHWKKAA